jgi:hypothetical protein
MPTPPNTPTDQTPDTPTDQVFVLAIPEKPGGKPVPFIITCQNGLRLLRFFVSPADAAMDGLVLIGGSGSMTIAAVDGAQGPEKNLRPCLHLAWQARGGRLMRDRDGMLLPVLYEMPRGHGKSINIKPSQKGLLAFGMIREMAGLYAWKETARAFFQWPHNRQLEAIQRGMETVRAGITDESGRFSEFALFDPERMQWHFVPVAALGELLEDLGSSLALEAWDAPAQPHGARASGAWAMQLLRGIKNICSRFTTITHSSPPPRRAARIMEERHGSGPDVRPTAQPRPRDTAH